MRKYPITNTCKYCGFPCADNKRVHDNCKAHEEAFERYWAMTMDWDGDGEILQDACKAVHKQAQGREMLAWPTMDPREED